MVMWVDIIPLFVAFVSHTLFISKTSVTCFLDLLTMVPKSFTFYFVLLNFFIIFFIFSLFQLRNQLTNAFSPVSSMV